MNMNTGTKSGTVAVPPEAEVSGRVEALLEQMSLEEKIGQLTQASGAAWPARCSG